MIISPNRLYIKFRSVLKISRDNQTYFVKILRKGQGQKFIPYRDPFTYHLVENLAARLLFYFGQCAKLSGIHFPNSEESQTFDREKLFLGDETTRSQTSYLSRRPSLDRIIQSTELGPLVRNDFWKHRFVSSDESRTVW